MAGFAAIVVANFALHIACVERCGNRVLSEHPSSDGRINVVVFQRDCGATTGFSTQVTLLPASEPLANEPGNLFAADTGGGAAPEGPWGGPVVLVRWSDAGHVVLHYHPRARVFHARRWRGIDVRYQPFW